nr:Protein F33G12.7 [Haemonchus contortus]
MRISSLLRIIIRGPKGQSVWREVTELRLPKGGKKLSFKQNSLLVFTGFLFLFGYCSIQEEVNPDSKWAEFYRTLTEEPFKWLEKDKTAEIRPAPSLSSHLR